MGQAATVTLEQLIDQRARALLQEEKIAAARREQEEKAEAARREVEEKAAAAREAQEAAERAAIAKAKASEQRKYDNLKAAVVHAEVALEFANIPPFEPGTRPTVPSNKALVQILGGLFALFVGLRLAMSGFIPLTIDSVALSPLALLALQLAVWLGTTGPLVIHGVRRYFWTERARLVAAIDAAKENLREYERGLQREQEPSAPYR